MFLFILVPTCILVYNFVLVFVFFFLPIFTVVFMFIFITAVPLFMAMIV